MDHNDDINMSEHFGSHLRASYSALKSRDVHTYTHCEYAVVEDRVVQEANPAIHLRLHIRSPSVDRGFAKIELAIRSRLEMLLLEVLSLFSENTKP